MEAIFIDAQGIIDLVGQYFSELEKKIGHPDAIIIEENIQKKLNEMNAMFDRLEIYILKEHPARKQGARLKLNQIKYDSQHLTASLRNFQKRRYQREKENTDREELLNRRFTTNREEETSIHMDYSIQHHNSLQNANKNIDDMISQGYRTIENLRGQKSMLKNTQKRMLDFLNTLGLSNTVMQLIERRTYQDKFILFGGMIITTTIVFFIYLYFV